MMTQRTACRIVVMGVAGSGKTVVGERLAGRLDAVFVDADAMHPPENVEKMAAGSWVSVRPSSAATCAAAASR